jgi:hypothetical protein
VRLSLSIVFLGLLFVSAPARADDPYCVTRSDDGNTCLEWSNAGDSTPSDTSGSDDNSGSDAQQQMDDQNAVDQIQQDNQVQDEQQTEQIQQDLQQSDQNETSY